MPVTNAGRVPMPVDPRVPLSLSCMQSRNGCWLLLAGRGLVAAFASRGEAADYARDLVARGVAVMVRFEGRRSPGFAGD